MKIIIAGAGDVGFHLAEMLAYENQDITLIDLDQEVLDYAASHLDVLTIKGDCGSIDVLEKAEAGQNGFGGNDFRENQPHCGDSGQKNGR